MKDIDLNSMSLANLKDLQARIEKEIANAETRRRKEALSALEATAGEFGLSLNEVLPGKSSAQSNKGRPVKFRHPQNSELEWSGRGRQPDWFKEALANGLAREDMLAA